MAENTVRTNPLASIMRQPKVYISLPSKGRFWPEGSLNPTVNGDYPVYSMTARDEIILKTPDALLNGQGIVDVIQSCMPNVLDAWFAPQIDLDAILVAIKIATYGENMTLDVTHPTIDDTMQYNVNLREVLDQIQNRVVWEERFEINPELVAYIKPVDYKTQSLALSTEFETQRIMNIIRDQEISEEQKVQVFKETFASLTEKSLMTIRNSVYKIESSAGTTDDSEFIAEFITNCDAEIFEAIKNKIEEQVKANAIPNLKVASTDEMKEKGAPDMLEVPLVFNASNFFR